MKNASHTIHCIGDSHVALFMGENDMPYGWPEPNEHRLPYFRVYRLGPVLAYNLCQKGTRSQGREKLFAVLKKEVPRRSHVLLCFGEIDCRAHLLKQSVIQQRPIEAVVRECVDRYFSVVREVMAKGHTVLIWNAVASAPDTVKPSPDFPIYGSCAERNAVTRLFNEDLKNACEAAGASFISIFDQLVDENGLTRPEFYMDGVHLSQRAMPLTVAALKPLVPAIDFDRVDLSTPYYSMPLIFQPRPVPRALPKRRRSRAAQFQWLLVKARTRLGKWLKVTGGRL